MVVFWAVCSDGHSEVRIPSDHVVASALCLVKAVTLGCVLIGSSLEDSWPVHFPLMQPGYQGGICCPTEGSSGLGGHQFGQQ